MINNLILEVLMKRYVRLILSLSLFLTACGDDNTTNPPAEQGSILLNKLVVSMAQGGIDSVSISSIDPNGAYSECSASSDNPGIASVSISDSIMQITGISIGTTNVTIINGEDISCVLPVEVYDKNILSTEELLIAYTDSFVHLSHGWEHSCWRPIPPPGFVALGSMAKRDSFPPEGIAVMVVKAKPGSDAIAFTDSFQTYPWPGNESCLPIPPPGYKAMGMIAGPVPDSAACIREDLTIPGELDTLYMHPVYSIWAISQPISGPHSGAYLATGMYVEVGDTEAPNNHPAANILNVNVPTLPDAPDQNIVPTLTSFNPPMPATQPMMGRCLLAPFSVITDAVHDIAWQLNNSAVYRVERETYYKLLYFNYNQTSELQTNSYTIISGITTTESETFRASVGLSVTASAGVALSSIATASISATVSYELGYERMTGISELQQREVTTSINTPPGKAAALWQKFTRFTVYRHLPFGIETVDSKEVGIDNYVTDEYPD
jgi:hypothetical protein